MVTDARTEFEVEDDSARSFGSLLSAQAVHDRKRKTVPRALRLAEQVQKAVGVAHFDVIALCLVLVPSIRLSDFDIETA